MKIPLDFFLRLIEKFLNEHELENVVKKLKKHFETPEEDFSDILSDLSLQDIISKYVKENKELKKKIKSKIQKYMEENKNEDEDENEEKLTTKKRKRTLSNANEEEISSKPEKKRKRTMSSTKEEKEEKVEKKRKRTMSNAKEETEEKKEEKKSKKKKKLEDNDNEEKPEDKMDEEEEKPKKSKNKDKKKKEEDEDIDLEKEVKFIPKPKSDNNPNRVPFKRIDDSKLKYEVPEKYRDNSYAAYLKQTGDDFGKAANDKLIVTRGKGFRKEKTKFKNKTFHGGVTISTTVRSIPLEDDSSED